MNDHIVDRAESYWRDALAPGERAAIEAHLAVCDDCRTAFESTHIALRALSSRPATRPLDARFEERVVATLRHQRRSFHWTQRVAAVVAFAAVCATSGFVAGRITAAAPSPNAAPVDSTLHQFLFLLEEPVWPPPAPLTRPGYREWVVNLADRYVDAEKLTEEPGYRITRSGDARPALSSLQSPNFSGWYIVKARSYSDAIRLARRGPHLSYGSILVRQVE